MRFSKYCIAKGTDDCIPFANLPDFALTADVQATNVNPGDVTTYNLTISPLRGFSQTVNLRLDGRSTPSNPSGAPDDLNLTGLPAASTATFNPSSFGGESMASALSISTSPQTPPGNYTLYISGTSADGAATRVATVSLVVNGVIGDVNGDGVVDCADVALVRMSLGSSVGNPAYNPSADFNGDGLVNADDMTFLTHLLPEGTTCPSQENESRHW